ncbi:surface protein [Saonia flava]|uniref:Surface protein n=1 Tax=Saonia flava TaxID=523696 RepID=A0A846QPB6_9FLAO|nr:BspA family leucine-rich repeat surface protein [Saonia flava]NJB69948.1 surface protein [Saonia flava]
MKKIIPILFFGLISLFANAQTEFITTWKTDNPGTSADNQITIPSYYGNFGEVIINWGDGTSNTYANSSNLSHTYTNPGTYTIEITGNFPGFYFKNWGDNEKIISVDQWGDIEWVAAQEAFSGCKNLDVLANDSPNLSKVTSTNQMFSGCFMLVGTSAFNNWNVSTISNMDSMFNSCTNFNAPIGNWDVSNVENMPAMFFNASSFNQDIGNWDVSNVKIMWAMFAGTDSFNQNIENWNVANVTQMGWMFSNSKAFNQPLGSWDVSSVTDMSLMFDGAMAFNQNISNWDVSQVTNMGSMFRKAESFNQPLNAWDMSNVTNTSNMFYYAFGFREDISSWNVSKVTNMSGMFNGATSFNRPLNNWDVSSVTDMTRMFQYAYSFNQDLSNWDVSKVTLMDNMFHRADTFKQDVSLWNITNVTSMDDMFLEIGMSKNIYDNILTAWSTLPQIQDNVFFNAGNSEYCDGKAGKEDLINNHGWIITDGGEVCFLPNQFVTKWKTDNPGTSADNQITIPTFSGETYDYLVDWGDGNVDSNVSGDITHTYIEPGTYYVSISGTFPRIFFNETGDKDKILTINQWGSNQWASMESAFAGCSNLSVAANDIPDLSNVTSLRRMFFYCIYAFDNSGNREFPNFNGIENFNDWDVSTITDMSNMFDKSSFYQDISQWNVSNVKNMSYMFFSSPFNFDISTWDVSNVTNMTGMFGSSNFNKDVTGWNVSSVTNMDFMFNSTYFDQDISNWDVSNVTSMRHMLSQCSFNQDISSWNIGNVTDMSNIFDDNDLSRENYDNILIAWSQLPSLQNGTQLGAKDVQYCLAKDARELLISTYNWSIVDQGENCEEYRPFVTTWKTDNPGPSEDNQITIPTNPREIYNYNVDWGDGTSDTGITEDITHTYAEPGTYQVSISGRFPHIYFNNSGEDYTYQFPKNTSDTDKIISIDQWGTNRWISMSFAFAGCSNLDVLATDIPDFSKDIHLSYMFYGCTSLKGNESMASWDLSYITMSAPSMFSGATQFNQPIENWDVSNIRYLDRMFENATSFNQNLENWNIGKVENMDGMFDGSGLSPYNYDKILKGWGNLPLLQSGVQLGASGIEYCDGETARQNLVDTYGWIIDDAGKNCQNSSAFITTWKTDNPGSSEDNQIIIPTYPGEIYDYTVDWGDGIIESNFTGDAMHTYLEPGTYQVSISGEFPRIYFNSLPYESKNDREKLVVINQWGTNQWKSMEQAFAGCSNLDVLATDIPDLSNVYRINSMFRHCSSLVLNPSIGDWDTSGVSSLGFLFGDCHLFNQDISGWDISNVVDLTGVFNNASLFNKDIGGWDLGKVKSLSVTFKGATSFNKDISNWNVSSVTQMGSMFGGATSFNQDISSWDVSNVTYFEAMFYNCTSFDQNIGNWDMSSANNISSMFSGATSFNQDITLWNVSNVTDMNSIFARTNIFNQDVGVWDVGNVTNMIGVFYEAKGFNRDLSNWNTSNITNMGSMFLGASSFNQNIAKWNVENVTNMHEMFKDATSFNQDIGDWNISKVVDMSSMFEGVELSTINYDSLLKGWSSLPSLQSNIIFNAGNSEYCLSEDARQKLIEDYGWTINDAGKDCSNTYFITTWKTDNNGASDDNQITIPTAAEYGIVYNYSVDWGDGTSDIGLTGDHMHTYDTPGTYTVAISGNFPWINFGDSVDPEKIIEVNQWGTNKWQFAASSFAGCSNLDVVAEDIPDFSETVSASGMFSNCISLVGNTSFAQWDMSNISNASSMFAYAENFNQDISNWDMGNVDNMSSMFGHALSFNQNIGNWNVSNVKDMEGMFAGSNFNGNIGNWDVSSVEDMGGMFNGNKVFNQDISTWDVSNVTDMASMFHNTDNFNQDISSWDVSNVLAMENMFNTAISFNTDIGKWNVGNVTSMVGMFHRAYMFNQDISLWDVGNVTNMMWMFDEAESFDQNLGNWDIQNVVNMNLMFDSTGLSTTNYDKTLIGWAQLPTLKIGVHLSAGTSSYCHGEGAKQYLIDNYFWSFDDAGKNCLDSSFFITTWKTDNPGASEDNQITIPTYPGESYNYAVDWGDGTSTSEVVGDITHTYGFSGTYTISITGNFPRIFFYNQGDRSKIVSVDQWGTNKWNSMEFAFYGCNNLDVIAIDAPDLSGVTSLNTMFGETSSLIFNSSINDWDTSSVENMQQLFSRATLFNQPLNNWDVSNVVNMSRMFQVANSFNQDIGSWNVGNVTNMESLFYNASSFNQDINNWNVSNVTNMNGLFRASAFNQDISGWNTSAVTSMYGMFVDNKVFNQNISSWNVGLVQNMGSIFKGATSFNQDISNWDISNTTEMFSMFDDSGLATENYDRLLVAWSQSTLVQNGVQLGAVGIEYCDGEVSKQYLIDNYGWTIIDGGKNVNCNADNDSDGVMDHLDECLNTPIGGIVNDKGCLISFANNFAIESIAETCPDQDNAQIKITAIEIYDYVATINGTNYDFTDTLVVSDLVPGAYDICITVPSQAFEQCYALELTEAADISGKSTVENGKMAITMEQGTAPYYVSVNGEKIMETYLKEISVDVQQGDFVEVATDKVCEGIFSQMVEGPIIISAYPNPTTDFFEISLPIFQSEVTIDLFTTDSQLISSRSYSIVGGRAKLDIENLPKGVYLAKVHLHEPITLKIVKQ